MTNTSPIWNNVSFGRAIKATYRESTLWSSLKLQSSSSGRLSGAQSMLSNYFINTDAADLLPKDTNHFIFQISYLHKITSVPLLFYFRKKALALENYETDARIICAVERTSGILSLLAVVTCFMVVLPSLDFFIGPHNRGSIIQSCKTQNRTESLYIWFMSCDIKYSYISKRPNGQNKPSYRKI